jgi:hypothetical protein
MKCTKTEETENWSLAVFGLKGIRGCGEEDALTGLRLEDWENQR